MFAKEKMTVSATKKETRDAATLTLKSSKKMDFKPGQFLMIELQAPEKFPKRAYSISSSPTKNETLQITVKEMPDGYVSKALNNAKKGDEALVDGPFGHFIFDPEKMGEIVLLAAGSGIAPFRCFMQYIVDKKLSTKVFFVYGCRTEEDLIFREELRGYAKKIPNCSLVFTLSREEKEGYRHGRIDESLLGEIVAKHPKAFYFICGPPAMVSSVKEILGNKGIEKERVKIEVYG